MILKMILRPCHNWFGGDISVCLIQHSSVLEVKCVKMPVDVHIGVDPVMLKMDWVWDQVIH